ncbi:MAG TPA: hypothetical protein DCZ95_13350 [Verrucomicrobia bacterium]|nr:MAG: hypothetical protein A2X46_11210 [Lentisphaerae bacterium GWF2_57_35]HBA85072.1 hypothetical protein [Verrucomicrobiota bacterium]
MDSYSYAREQRQDIPQARCKQLELSYRRTYYADMNDPVKQHTNNSSNLLPIQKPNPIGVLLVVLSIGWLTGCASPPIVYQPGPLTPAEREEIQARTLNASMDTAFAATIAVLQDEGWDLQEIRKDSGVIQAMTKRREAYWGPSDDWRYASDPQAIAKFKKEKKRQVINQWMRWEKLTAHIEPWGAGKSRNRISILKFGALPSVTYMEKLSGKEFFVNSPTREDHVMEEEPLAYSRIFARIETAIKDRKMQAP